MCFQITLNEEKKNMKTFSLNTFQEDTVKKVKIMSNI